LARIAGARNCPECGLAVRISLSDNSNLEWTNPRWQYFLAVAFAILIVGLLCRILGSAARWIIDLSFMNHHRLDTLTFGVCDRLSIILRTLWPFVAGIALCLLAKSEQRYPDKSRGSRMLMLGAGIFLCLVSLVYLAPRYQLLPIGWTGYVIWRIVSDPWPSVVLAILGSAFSLELARRGNSRLLRKMSQLPLWPAAGGTVVWLFNIQRLFWPLRSIIWDWLFPLSMIAMLVVTIRVLLRGACEARLNWVTDP
jgi:hypothetical protein